VTRVWQAAIYGCAVVMALSVGYFVATSPLQINDCIDNMLELQRQTLSELLVNQLHQQGYLRPMLWAALKVPFDLANGHYFAMFKAIHVLQLVTLAVLFVRLLGVGSVTSVLAVPLGLTLLFGNHTVGQTAMEGFPINTFLTVMICCLATASLAFGKPSIWRDAAAVVLFLFAALTVETGLLVWVIVAAAWIGGCRGASNRMLVATSVALLGYFVFRFGVLEAGMPSLLERSSGFGFRMLEHGEVAARFGDRPLIFYAYNVVAHTLTVLFAEPRHGVFVLTRDLLAGALRPREVIAVVGATGATLLIAGYAIARAGHWRRREINDHDRLILIFVAVLCGNAAIGHPYAKAPIVSVAGVFHALAATVAASYALAALARASIVRPAVIGLTIALTLLSGVSTIRFAALHFRLYERAWTNKNDWAHQGPTTTRWQVPDDPTGQAMIRRLYEQSMDLKAPGIEFLPRWMERYFEEM